MDTKADVAGVAMYRAARLADMRQRLATPSRAISEYCEFIVTSAATLNNPDLNDDLQRIDEAAVQLNTLVDHLLTVNCHRSMLMKWMPRWSGGCGTT